MDLCELGKLLAQRKTTVHESKQEEIQLAKSYIQG